MRWHSGSASVLKESVPYGTRPRVLWHAEYASARSQSVPYDSLTIRWMDWTSARAGGALAPLVDPAVEAVRRSITAHQSRIEPNRKRKLKSCSQND